MESLSQIGQHIWFGVTWPIMSLFVPSSQINIFFLPSSLAVMMAVYLWRHRRVSKIRLRLFLRYLFPRKILLHPSAVLDYKYFVANRMLRGLFYAPLLLSSVLYDQGIIAALTALFGPGHAPSVPSWTLTALATLLFIVSYDFAYWLIHWCMHRVPLLWEFHKVHHSAEVLTPITALRVHPVEELININMVALMTGTTHGIAVYCFGEGAQQLSLLQLNVVLLIFFFTLYHLRHSHVWLEIKQPWNYIFLSPAQHQIHHSTARRHLDKNLGYLFAVWDHAFGTVYVPKGREHLKMGIGVQSREFNSLWRLYSLPFVKVMRRWGPKRRSVTGTSTPETDPHSMV
ncbi:MAG: sterol desaturase family protein [Alphaproteobacteria bacterium]